MPTSEFAIILSTCKNREEAEAIAIRLVSNHAAACVSLVDKVTSIYEWKGTIEHANEVLLIIKTRFDAADRVQAAITRLSSYECPEVVVLPIVGGSEDYLRWLSLATKGDPLG